MKNLELVECSDFIIEDLGIMEEWVYDIEVKDNHNFFGNDILVHNSTYNYFRIPFNKYKDINKTVLYSEKVAKDCNLKYRNVFDTLLKSRANIDPKWNKMNFKSEVIAVRAFFNTKKFYAMAKIWLEGTFYEDLEIKKTGGQILKADTSKVTLEMLNEIYSVINLELKYDTVEKIKHQIFSMIRKKYTDLLTRHVNDFNFKTFVIPKKWQSKKTKTVPVQVKGAQFFNLAFSDIIRPGDSILMVPVIINTNMVYRKYQNYKRNEYQIPNELINNKLNIISFPSDYDFQAERENIFMKLQQLDIKIDFDRIINFNIEMKITQFDKLFFGDR